MEQKHSWKTNLLILFLILALIVIIVMGIFIFKFYTEKIEADKKYTELQTQLNNLNITVNNSENTIDNIVFTDEKIKSTLSDFLELKAHANCDSLLENLTEKGKLNYNPSTDTIHNDGTVITKIKFSDYKNAMLNYVSEKEFEKNWSSALYFSENSNGYLTKIQGGGGLCIYTIKEILKNNDSTYSAKTIYTIEDDPTAENEDFTFTIKSYNGNCVIDSIK